MVDTRIQRCGHEDCTDLATMGMSTRKGRSSASSIRRMEWWTCSMIGAETETVLCVQTTALLTPTRLSSASNTPQMEWSTSAIGGVLDKTATPGRHSTRLALKGPSFASTTRREGWLTRGPAESAVGKKMANHQRCRHTDCATRPSFFLVGSKRAESCINHAKEGDG